MVGCTAVHLSAHAVRRGMGPLLASIHRIRSPGPKTPVANWYGCTTPRRCQGFPGKCFTSHACQDCLGAIEVDPAHLQPHHDELEPAQGALTGAFRRGADPLGRAWALSCSEWLAERMRRRNESSRHDPKVRSPGFARDRRPAPGWEIASTPRHSRKAADAEGRQQPERLGGGFGSSLRDFVAALVEAAGIRNRHVTHQPVPARAD